MRAIIYAFYSIEQPDRIEEQIAKCKQYATENGIEIVDTFSEMCPRKDRVFFNIAVQKAFSNEADALIIPHPSIAYKDNDLWADLLNKFSVNGKCVLIPNAFEDYKKLVSKQKVKTDFS